MDKLLKHYLSAINRNSQPPLTLLAPSVFEAKNSIPDQHFCSLLLEYNNTASIVDLSMTKQHMYTKSESAESAVPAQTFENFPIVT